LGSVASFEQTVALRAVEKMLSSLDAQQKKDLEAALIEQRNYNPEEKRWIQPDSNRWIISDRILSALPT
jgi:hypothetical protein